MCQAPSSPAVPRGSRGFALIITITLLAFLVLLVVSLASLTRVETQIADNSRQLSAARQNALLALNIALGQLQKYAGPDQRTTARADLQHGPDAPNARWTGVYGPAVVASYSQSPSQLATAIAAATPDTRGSTARLLTWLVSGNETAPFDPSADVGSSGEISTPPPESGIPFRPDQPTTLVPADSAQPFSAPTIDNGDDIPARLLVGSGSVESATANGVPIDAVIAPLVDLKVPTGLYPGDPAPSPVIGRYAWWVGDEGMKARINLPEPASLNEKINTFAASPRAAVELANLSDAELPLPSLDATRLGAAYDPASGVEKILATNQLPLASPSHAAALSTASRHRFHDLTAHSLTVLADTAVGGLKLDLSSALAPGATAPADTQTLFTSESDGAYAVPTWGHLRAFAQRSFDSAAPVALAPTLPTAGRPGIAPVLTYASLGFQYFVHDGSIRLALFPLVVLWNPYTVPLAPAEYEVGFSKRYNTNGQLQLEVETAPNTWVARETRNLNRGLAASGGTADSYIRFRISTDPIPAGRSLIFTLTGSESGATYGAGGNRLTNALDPGGHAWMAGPAVAPGEETARYRVIPATNIGGEMDAFLGSWPQPSNPIGYDPSGKNWHQAVQRIGITNSAVTTLQDAAPLGPVTESQFSFRVQAVFSGHGSNAIAPIQKLRWIAQANPRAPLITRLPDDPNANLTYTGSINAPFPWQNFTVSPPGTHASAGAGHDAASGPVDATLFEFPHPGRPLLSLGRLQHAPLSLAWAYPSYAFGNSLADYRFATGLLHKSHAATTPYSHHYDLSWLLNHALWDSAFFSGVPASSVLTSGAVPGVLDNPRHLRLDANDTALRQSARAAAHLLLSGGFNVNSTSEQAWRAVLGGLNRLAYDPVGAADDSALAGSPLPRFARPAADHNLATPWQGYRLLADEQIAQLARDIVAGIRARGPFVSLADFVNRRLVDNASTSADERLKGTLQAALDATTTVNPGVFPVNADTTEPFRASDGLVDALPPFSGVTFLLDHMRGGPASVAPYSSRSAFAPKHLTQADILSAVGAGLAARSDTFIIRAYGETINPLQADAITGRAWCEAVVQRQPDYMNADDAAHDSPTATANRYFGRRFSIVSFRWLSPSDI